MNYLKLSWEKRPIRNISFNFNGTGLVYIEYANGDWEWRYPSSMGRSGKQSRIRAWDEDKDGKGGI